MRNHLLAWVLSFETARRHHPHTALVTDDEGARLLVDGLGLEFETVSLALQRIEGIDPTWWTVGKFLAIAEQDQPFVHLDADVFLWDPLPADLLAAPVFSQNPEPFHIGDNGYYRPELIESVLAATGSAWLPEEWTWYRRAGVRPRGECCGIVGGTNVELLRHWAEQGLRLLRDPANAEGLALLPDRPALMITVEQYLLAACVEHHRGRLGSPFRDAGMTYLFRSWAEAADDAQAAARGFTHLIADTKSDEANALRLQRRVAEDYPDHYARCVRLTGGTSSRRRNFAVAPDSQLLASA